MFSLISCMRCASGCWLGSYCVYFGEKHGVNSGVLSYIGPLQWRHDGCPKSLCLFTYLFSGAEFFKAMKLQNSYTDYKMSPKPTFTT